MKTRSLMGISKEIARQRERLFVWAPVAFGAGIALYFALSFEPAAWVGATASALLIGPAYFSYRHHLDDKIRFFIWLAICATFLAALGFTAAQIGTYRHGIPIIAKKMDFANLRGTIETMEYLGDGKGSRAILRDISIEGVAPENTPRKIRLRFRKDEGLKPGARIETLASLDAPGRAVAPNAYDFRRHLFFEGIGAVGFAYRAPVEIQDGNKAESVPLEHLREIINRHIYDRAGKVSAGIMTALITGERGAIADEDNEAMRDSGLYHLLSISGAHVTMVAGMLFFFFRGGMAAIPYIALHWPVKKIAAGVALAGAAFYVLLAGAEIPAQRALLMTGLIMIAIMLDRSPFSLRLIALAAFAVLALFPHTLIGVSFQMSFAAVAALIVFFDYTRPHWNAWRAKAGFFRKSALYLAGILMTSIIAGTITGLFTLYHFQTFPVYGVLANMIAVPITGIVIMPAAIVALFLMPFGLEGWALDAMEWGTLWVVITAHWAAGLHGAVIQVTQWSASTYALIVCGVVLILLWQGWRGKSFAALLITLALIIASASKFPDILVSDGGKLVGIHQNGNLYVSTRRTDKFTAQNWMRLAGRKNERPKTFRTKGSPVNCDADGCRAVLNNGAKIAIPKNPRAFHEDCAWSDIIISQKPLKKWQCETNAVMLDLYDFRDNGAHAVYVRHGGVTVRSTGKESGIRPWTLQNDRRR